MVIDNPPPELRGAKLEKAVELAKRLKELTTLPEPGSGLVGVGRQLQEIEQRELYKLIGYSTFSEFCRKQLGLSRKYQSLFALVVELADIDPFFDIDNPDPEIPEDFAELDWDTAKPLLEELVELSVIE